MLKANDSELTVAMLDAIQDKRVLPLKFAYTGSAAQAHLKLAALDSYKEVTLATVAEADMTISNNQTASLAIADIGPGDGQHSAAFLRELHKRSQTISSYIGLDFSPELMAVAEQHIQGVLDPVTVSFERWDIEAGATDHIRAWRKNSHAQLMVSFLGQTLGNLEDPIVALRNIRDSVEVADTLLLSVALQIPNRTPDDYLRSYQNPTFMEAIAEPLRMIGIDTKRGKLSLSYEDNAVVGTFTLTADQAIRHPLRSPLTLSAGITIRCFISRRFKSEDIEKMLHTAGWKLLKLSRQSEGIGVYSATANPNVN